METLRWFQLVADGTTVTEVAELSQVSQPGVSRALARLEKEVGSPLLLRRGRMLRSTHAGAVFKRHVDAALHDLDDGLAAVDELIDPETGSVSVAFQLSLGAWLVPDLVDTFRRDHPRVRFRLLSSDDARGSMVLVDGQLDLELTARQPREEGVSWERLFTQPLVLAVALDHRLADRSEVSLDEVADEDFVMLRPSWELRAQTDACAARPASRPARRSRRTTWPSYGASWPPGSASPSSRPTGSGRGRPTAASGT